MSKRRNKNKKAGPVKIIRPGDLAAPVDAPAAPAVEQAEDNSAMSAAPDIGDGGDEAQAHEEQATASFDVESSEGAPPSDQPSDESVEHGEPLHEFERASIQDEAPAANQDDAEPLREFEDASGLLAQAIPVDPSDVRQRREFESIPIVDPSASAFEPVEAQHSEEESVQPPVVQPVEDSAVGEGRTSRKQDRKLRLNKLQKHARSVPEPEPELEVVAPEPVVAWQAPREPRIAAFAKLSEYQSLSLAHVAGLPEEAD
ncbi:MAG TPA: hypothetical protein VK753_08330, partial [Xanthomonadaceae bacterium]|nr:hypothetical protein [Xanthomonadaceae bacterium]